MIVHAIDTEDLWIANAVMDAGRPHFQESLLRGLRAATGADHISHVVLDDEGRVRRAAAMSWRDQPPIQGAVEAFVNGWRERDPNYPWMLADPTAAIDVSIVSQSSAAIADLEYRHVMFDQPGFVGKVSLIGKCARRVCYLNIYFSSEASSRSRALAVLRRHGATLTSLTRHDDAIADRPARPASDAGDDGLSPREREVVALLRQGHTAKQVARTLGVAPSTIVTYKTRIFEKLGVANVRELLVASRH